MPAPFTSIVHAHITTTKNIGDLASAPYRYFDMPGEPHDVRSMPACDIAIIGGGALGLLPRSRFASARMAITWGVGASRHGQKEPGPAPDGFDLYGSREWQQPGAIYAPCASCMSPLFDARYQITHETVGYLNAGPIRQKYPRSVSGLPLIFNTATLEEVIAFLGSAETVVTDSYHGTYWATLLGRRVVCMAYSSKFYGFKFPPAYAEDGDWQRALPHARFYPEALHDARSATKAFYERVRSVMEPKMETKNVPVNVAKATKATVAISGDHDEVSISFETNEGHVAVTMTKATARSIRKSLKSISKE